MGANIFRAFPTIPTGVGAGVTATIVSSDLEPEYTFLLNCAGDAPVGTISIEGSLDGGITFDTIGQFTLGQDSDPVNDEGSPRPFVLIPPPLYVVGKSTQLLRARVEPGTNVRSNITITIGAEENCDCAGSAFPGFGNIVAVDAAPNVNGVSGLVARADHKHQVLTAVPTGDIDVGDAAVEGVATELARADHQHAFPAPVAAPPAVGTGAIGVATTPARSDHTHDGVTSIGGATGVFTFAAPGAAVDIGDAAVEGVAMTLVRSDHQHAVPAPAAPPPAVGTGAIGVATTPARSDHTHDGVTSIGGNTGAFAFGVPVNVDKSANAAGASNNLSRSDHKHDVTTAVPSAALDIGDAAAEGVAVSLARSDHQHAFPAPGVAPPAVGTGAVGVATTPARSDHTHDGVSSVTGPSATVTGAITLNSPMLTQAAGVFNIDNGNQKELTDAASIVGSDVSVNNAFRVTIAATGHSVAIPSNLPAGNRARGEKITYNIRTSGGTGYTLAWAGGAGGFLFAVNLGPTQSDFDNLLAATPDGGIVCVGWQYDHLINRWMCVALAGYFI